ncbi:hypothetical protein KGM_215604 [Danaus plexippus plexippus]|uniref:Uncharacterized protein n=1 Tax=Danaus plexippus plexippus TaxID=278856 RepID=A0A212EYG0_DANPL|nr:hypothetical protein KGM_215604 [Danaus plexippus plexippus]
MVLHKRSEVTGPLAELTLNKTSARRTVAARPYPTPGTCEVCGETISVHPPVPAVGHVMMTAALSVTYTNLGKYKLHVKV